MAVEIMRELARRLEKTNEQLRAAVRARARRRRVTARRGSRLDSFIRRLEAQRACLDWAVGAIAACRAPSSSSASATGAPMTICARAAMARARSSPSTARWPPTPRCIPDAAHLVLGDFRDTLPAFAAAPCRTDRARACRYRLRRRGGDAELARWLGPQLAPLLATGRVVLSDQPLDAADAPGAWRCPTACRRDRYFIYRTRAAAG